MPPRQFTPDLRRSKLHPPRLTLQHVPRPRLVERLRRQVDCALILVRAPAGSGKSTLLSEWIGASDVPTAWVSLDDSDNDLITFVSYVLAAIRTIAPTVTFQTHSLLQAVPPPPLNLLATSLSNDLEQINNDFLLVFDDYHVITDPQIDAIVSQLILHPARAMHLAVATRTEPAWPLVTLQTRGQIAELR